MQPLALVLNLDGADERLAHFAAQAAQAGLVFERLPAVHGRAMPPQDVTAAQDDSAIYPLSAAELGCSLSHRRAWMRIVESGCAWGVVFEDDACLSAETGSILAQLPSDRTEPTIIKLECSNGEPLSLGRKEIRFAGRTLRSLRGISIGSAGYAITRSACQKLLAAPPRYAVPLDLYLFSQRHGAFRGLEVLMMTPAPVIQADRRGIENTALASGIAERGKRLRPRPAPLKLVKREIYRLREGFLGLRASRTVIDWG